MDSSARLLRLGPFPALRTAPDAGDFDGADSGLDLVLSACPVEVQGEVAEAAGLPEVARVARAVAMWLGLEVGAFVGEGA